MSTDSAERRALMPWFVYALPLTGAAMECETHREGTSSVRYVLAMVVALAELV